MINLIVSIFALIGLCESLYFIVHLIEKMNKNSNKQENKRYYWYVNYSFGNGSGSAFIWSSTKIFNLNYYAVAIKEDDPNINGNIVITSFIEVSKEFYEINNQ